MIDESDAVVRFPQELDSVLDDKVADPFCFLFISMALHVHVRSPGGHGQGVPIFV